MCLFFALHTDLQIFIKIEKLWRFIGNQDFLPKTQPNSMANYLMPEKIGYKSYTWKNKQVIRWGHWTWHVKIIIDIWKLSGSFRNRKPIEFGRVRLGNMSVVEKKTQKSLIPHWKESAVYRAKYTVWWFVSWVILTNTSETQAHFSWKCLKDICSYTPTPLSVWISILPLNFLYIILVLGALDLHRSKWHHLATDSPSVTLYQVTHAFI